MTQRKDEMDEQYDPARKPTETRDDHICRLVENTLRGEMTRNFHPAEDASTHSEDRSAVFKGGYFQTGNRFEQLKP